MPKKIRTLQTDHLLESEVSYMLPIYLTRIHKVIFMDTGDEVKLNTNDKNVYGYLSGIGHNQGYNSIYPNIDQISLHLGITTKTVSNSLNTLEKVKLLKRERTKRKGKWDSTFYWLYRPNMIDRMRWIDINGSILQGKHYRFDAGQFHRYKDKSSNKVDKLLDGLIELERQAKNSND